MLTVDLAKDTGGASFSPDGRLLAVPGQDGTVQVLDASTGAKFTTLRAPDGPYCSPAFSPDGTRIAASACPYVDSAGRAVVWEVASGRRLVLTDPYEDWISGWVFSPDGGRLAGRTGGTAAIWDAWTGKKLVPISGHSGEVYGVSFSRDGTRIATGSEDGTARVWDAATGEELVRLSGHDGLVALVDFSPDGTRLLTGGGDGTARVWDVSDTAGAEVWSEHVATGQVGGLEYDADGTRLVTADGGGGWVLDPPTGERLTPIGWGWEDASFSPDGGRVAASGDGAAILDVASRKVVRRLVEASGWVSSIEYSPDGSIVATGLGDTDLGDTDLGTGTAVLWDAVSGRRVRTLGPSHPDAVLGLAFSPDGEMLALLGDSGRLEVWDVDTGNRLMNRQAHPGNGSDLGVPAGRQARHRRG